MNQKNIIIDVERAVFELKAGNIVRIKSGNESVNVCSLEARTGVPSGQCAELIISGARAAMILGKSFPGDFAIGLPFDSKTKKYADDIAGLSLKDKVDKNLMRNARKKPAIFAATLKLAKIAELIPALFLLKKSKYSVSVDSSAILKYEDQLAKNLDSVLTAPLTLEKTRNARITVFKAPGSNKEHYAVIVGQPEKSKKPPLIRIHSTCFTGDVLASLKCDCRDQLQGALGEMNGEGAGILLYLMQEGRGIGLANKLRTYSLQADGLDTVEANNFLGFNDDERPFLAAATMLKKLGFNAVRLITNNPRKAEGLEKQGVEVVEMVGLLTEEHEHNKAYLDTKFSKLGHTK